MGACMQGCLQKLQELADKKETDHEDDRESGHYDGAEKEDKPTSPLKADGEIPNTQFNTMGTSVPTKTQQRPTPNPSHHTNHMHTNQQNHGHNNNGHGHNHGHGHGQGRNNNGHTNGYGRATAADTTSPQPSVLGNFQEKSHTNYDRNQYGSVRSANKKNRSPFLTTVSTNGAQPYPGPMRPSSPMSRDSTFGGGAVPDHRMLDAHGNVHVNKYYNVTRNHNLSVASKFTDMSEIPSHVGGGGGDFGDVHHPGVGLPMSYTQTNTTHMGLHPTPSGPYGLAMPPRGAMSLESANSGVLWDDDEFSDQRSVMSAMTEVTQTRVESR